MHPVVMDIFCSNRDAMHQCLARFYYFGQREYDQPHRRRFAQDEVREHIVFDAGKKSDCTIRFNSNVRWSTSSTQTVTRHSTSHYYCWVSSGASRHRSNQKTVNTFFLKYLMNDCKVIEFKKIVQEYIPLVPCRHHKKP